MKIKGGGFEGLDGWVFELSGGRVCLDFVNTVDNRPTEQRRELLRSYADLVDWSRQTAVIREDEAKRLAREAERYPSEATSVLQKARALREALFNVFESAVARRPAPSDAMATLNDWVPAAFAEPEIRDRDGSYTLVWKDEAPGLDRMLPAVVRSAVELLTSPELSRIRVCAAAACGWLFLDRSRNRTRQWCDMSVCGNRAKARRHYRRSKKRPPL